MEWIEKIKVLPMGYSKVNYEGKKYAVTRSDFNDGKSIKIYAKELGGTGFVSFNYYLTKKSSLLKPCEMPRQKIMHFLETFKLITNQ